MSLGEKVLIRVKAFFKAALGLVVFLLVDYGFYQLLCYLGLDYDTYKGTHNFITSILCFVAMFIVHKISSKNREPLVRFNKLSPDQIGALIVVGLGMLGFVSIYLSLSDLIAEKLQPMQDAMDEYRDNVDRYVDVPQAVVPVWDSILYICAICFIVPFSEEMTFRGVIFGQFRRGFGIVASVILSAVVFGLMHGVSVHIGYALVCGAVMATCYYLTDSIFSTIILHAVFNIFGSGIPNVFEVKQFGIPVSTANKIMLTINTAQMLFTPVAVIAIMYLVAVKRKKDIEKKLAEENIVFEKADNSEDTKAESDVSTETAGAEE